MYAPRVAAGLTPVKPRLLPRILELNRGQPCYIVGTVYMDMPLKPNVLEDMARSVSVHTFCASAG